MVPVLWGFLCPWSQQTQEERPERGMMSGVHTGTRGAGGCLGASAEGPQLRAAPRSQRGGLPCLQGSPGAARPRRLTAVSRPAPPSGAGPCELQLTCRWVIHVWGRAFWLRSSFPPSGPTMGAG